VLPTSLPNAGMGRAGLSRVFRGRERNRSLPKSSRLRVLACDPPIDWSHVSTLADAARRLDRDAFCAALVEREVIVRRHRALPFMGDGHVVHRNLLGNPTGNTVSLIEAKHPDSVFVIVTYLGQYSESAAIENRLNNGPIPTLVSLSDEWPGDLLAVPPEHQLPRVLVRGRRRPRPSLWRVRRDFERSPTRCCTSERKGR
jgi:hypothetical protein